MAGVMNEKPYQPKRSAESYQVDFFIEKDMDFTSPYPCGVCRRSFSSRYELAHHSHSKETE